MPNGIQVYEGTARNWYDDLVRSVLENHETIPC